MRNQIKNIISHAVTSANAWIEDRVKITKRKDEIVPPLRSYVKTISYLPYVIPVIGVCYCFMSGGVTLAGIIAFLGIAELAALYLYTETIRKFVDCEYLVCEGYINDVTYSSIIKGKKVKSVQVRTPEGFLITVNAKLPNNLFTLGFPIRFYAPESSLTDDTIRNIYCYECIQDDEIHDINDYESVQDTEGTEID